MAEVSRITVEEARQRLERGEPLAFVDARSEDSWKESDSQIPGSIRVPPDAGARHLDEIPRERAVLSYCT